MLQERIWLPRTAISCSCVGRASELAGAGRLLFGFNGGPQSPREIEELFNELEGPEAAAAFWHSYRDAYVTEEDIRFLRDTGANSIRIPLHYKFFTPGNEEGFALLDRVVGWAAKYHLYVILDMHCAPGGQRHEYRR